MEFGMFIRLLLVGLSAGGLYCTFGSLSRVGVALCIIFAVLGLCLVPVLSGLIEIFCLALYVNYLFVRYERNPPPTSICDKIIFGNTAVQG